METIITILAPSLALVIGALVGWLLKKWGLDPAVVVKATELVQSAVMRVEETAKRQAAKIPAPQKLKAALSLLNTTAAAHPEVADYLRKNATAMVERVLHSSLTPDEMTPK